MELDSARLAQGLALWESDGRQTVKDILLAQTANDIASTSTIPVSNTLLSLLRSGVTAEGIGEFLFDLVQSLEEERKEILWEALADSVSVLVEDRDDTADLRSGEGMEIDGQMVIHPGDKGVQVIKSLLVRSFV
jgi:hypothetical protein